MALLLTGEMGGRDTKGWVGKCKRWTEKILQFVFKEIPTI